MSNEFDLERAKTGGSVVCKTPNGWDPVHFVGLSRSGFPVVEGQEISAISADHLRMAPKKTVWYGRYYVNDQGIPKTAWEKSKEVLEYKLLEGHYWLGESFSIEVSEK